MTSGWRLTSSTNPTYATSTHSTSSQKLSQEETDFNHEEETTKPQVPGNSHILEPSDLQKLDVHSDKCTRCGDTLHAKGFQCPARKFQCKICHKFGHFTTICYQKSQQPSSSFKTRKPKAQQLCAGALYTHHNADRSGSETSDTEDSFYLQMKIQKYSSHKSTGTQTNILDDQFSLLSTVTSQEKPVSQGMIRHMCRCESDANGCVLPYVQRPRSEKTHFL